MSRSTRVRTICFTHKRIGSRFGILAGRKTVMVGYTHYRILQYLAITNSCYPELSYVSVDPITNAGTHEVCRLQKELSSRGIKNRFLLNDGHGHWKVLRQRHSYLFEQKALDGMDPQLKEYIAESPYPERLEMKHGRSRT
jgi:hypothetical protein